MARESKQIENTMLINQIASIGDIIFIQPLCKELGGCIVPVRDHLRWLNSYLPNMDIRPMSECKRFFNPDDYVRREKYLPLRWANQLLRGYDLNDHHDFENMMLDKYRYAGVNEDLWRNIDMKFNFQKAQRLYKQLNPNDEPYILVNEFCQAGKIEIETKPKFKRIDMRRLGHYLLPDWFIIITNALEFHTVSTSTFYLLQAMHNQCFDLPTAYIYPRPNEDGLRGISQLEPDFDYYEMD